MTLPNLVNHPDSTDMTTLKRWREIRSNSRDALLAKNQNASVDVDCTAGGTIVLTVNQREPVIHIRLTGSPGSGYTVEFADGNKQIDIENVSGQTATIETATGAATPPTIINGQTKSLFIAGTDIFVIGILSLEDGALQRGGGVMPTSGIDFNDQCIKKVTLIDHSAEVTSPSSSGGTLTLNMENGNWFDVTLTENVTSLVLSNPANSPFQIELEDGLGRLELEAGDFLIGETTNAVANCYLIARQDGGGTNVITWPASFIWERFSGQSPDQSLGGNDVDLYWFFSIDGGVTWYAFVLGLDMG